MANRLTTVGAPVGWGQDSLTAYLDDFRGNQYATFDKKRAVIGDLIAIDGLFLRFLKDAVNPRPFFPMGFLLRGHSAFRAAAGAVMGGQLYEAQSQLRACLEQGAYGFYIGADRERWERWMARHDSRAQRDAVVHEFTNRKVARYIKSAAAEIGRQYEALYERLVDFGAHPNERGFSLSSAISKSDGSVRFDTIYLHGDGTPLDLGLRTTAQAGLWVLHIAQLIYPARFQLLGIRPGMEEIRKRY